MFSRLFNKKTIDEVYIVNPIEVKSNITNAIELKSNFQNEDKVNVEKEKNLIPLFNKKGPKIKDSSNVVRIRFSKKRPPYRYPVLNLYLGREIAKVINVGDGDRALLFHDANSPKTILIKKATEEDQNSYKIYSHISKHCLWIQVSWPLYKPSPSHYRLTQVDTSFQDDGLLIKLYEGKWL